MRLSHTIDAHLFFYQLDNLDPIAFHDLLVVLCAGMNSSASSLRGVVVPRLLSIDCIDRVRGIVPRLRCVRSCRTHVRRNESSASSCRSNG